MEEARTGIDYYSMISYFNIIRLTAGRAFAEAAPAEIGEGMRGKHEATLRAVFADPVSGSIKWREIEAMLVALGAEMSEGSGSRVRFTIAGQTLFLHRPHPSPNTKRWAIRDIREFLTNVGIRP